jgi:hypothetical protein
MIAQVITENGQKKIKPLTADAGAGNPVGTIIPMYKKSSPSGYLYCDGSTFDQTKYPLLYAYLGSNVLPDYREFALVGAEENTTDVYNASTNPNGTIHDHDVYTEGQAKDDAVQNFEIQHNQGGGGQNWTLAFTSNANYGQYLSGISKARVDNVTRGKRKAVYFYIKATSGLSENAQDNVINTLNEERSYSTEEVNTGKKWIDGKDIYRLVIINLHFTTGTRLSYNLGNNISTAWIDFTHSHVYGYFGIRQPWNQSDFYVDSGVINFTTQHPDGYLCAVVEYTKTT